MSFEVTVADLHRYAISEAATAGYNEEDLRPFLDAATVKAYSFIRSQYPVPLPFDDLSLKVAVCQIAAYMFMTRRGFDMENPEDEALRAAHDSAIKWLLDVSNGRASLSGGPGNSGKSSAGARVYSGRSRRGW